MKIKLFGLVVILSFFNIAFADSAIVERVKPKGSAIIRSNMSFSASTEYGSNKIYKDAISDLENKILETPEDYASYVSLAEFYVKIQEYEKAYEKLAFLYGEAKQNRLSLDDLNLIEEFSQTLKNNIKNEKESFWNNIYLTQIALILQDSALVQKYLVNSSKEILNMEVFGSLLEATFTYYDEPQIIMDISSGILEYNPDLHFLKKVIVRVLLRMNRVEECLRELEVLIPAMPEDFALKYYLFKALQSQGVSEKEIFKRMYPKQRIDYEKAYQELANIFYEDSDLTQAKIFTKRVLEKNPDNVDAYILLSEICKKEGNLKEAYEALNFVRDKADNDEQISKYNVLLAQLSDQPVKEADSLMTNGLYSQALSVLQSADQENLYVILGQARANYFLDNKQVAFDFLNKAMSLYPNNPDVFYYFAYIFYEEKDLESSRKYIQEALKIAPEHAFSLKFLDVLNKADSDRYINQILSAFDSQNYEEAMRLVKEALSINKKDSVLYYYQGLIYIAMNNYAASTAPLFKAIELDKNNTLAYFYLALSFDNLAETDNALAYYRKFLAKLPADDYAESEKLNYAKSRIEKLSK